MSNTQSDVFLGIDGEGQGRENHTYVYLAAAGDGGGFCYAASSPSWEAAWNDTEKRFEPGVKGLSTVECLDFILRLPSKARIFAYAFNYDLTKILTDCDDKTLYFLFRPELRPGKGKRKALGPEPIWWHPSGDHRRKDAYRLNMVGTKFVVAHLGTKRTIWDVFKFYQSKFVGALKDWKVGSEEMRAHMTHMKDKRADFDRESPGKVKAYCLEECRYMAELARKLCAAHEQVQLPLKTFYGAGSSAGAMLGVMGIRKQLRKPPSTDAGLKHAIACAFFGGRFENSVIGPVEGQVWNYDISSAYPYHITFLPCLLHGYWIHTTDPSVMRRGKTAIVRYELGPNRDVSGQPYDDWGPLPFRDEEGCISFPIESGGGWVYKKEFLEAQKTFAHVQFCEAWVYLSSCECRPFARIPEYYAERCRIGKEGPGIVLKLGCNSCYGKLAQSIGSAQFNNWVWAGMITSGCRAQILHMMRLHEKRSDLLMIATDGIYTRQRLTPPTPKDTGTGHTGKPLGGWEEQSVKQGVFMARPGIYFPLNPTTEHLTKIRGRGVGKSVVFENWRTIVDSWTRYRDSRTVRVANVQRFCGAKTSISRAGDPSGLEGDWVYNRAKGGTEEHEDGTLHQAPRYGNWIVRPVDMSFSPLPKREMVNLDGLTLKLRSFPSDATSQPYDNAKKSQENKDLAAFEQEILEQPDADLSEYGFGDEGN
jgi:hypothetical protein